MSNRIPRKPKKSSATNASAAAPVCLAGDLKAFPQGHIIRFFHTDKEMFIQEVLLFLTFFYHVPKYSMTFSDISRTKIIINKNKLRLEMSI
jgi:hypothetical protein